MKHLKMLAMAAVAATALIAFAGAGTASATVLCKNNLNTSSCSEDYGAGTEVKFNSTMNSVLHAGGGIFHFGCGSSSFSGKTDSTGGSANTVSIPITAKLYDPCGCGISVISYGTLELHHVSGTDDATVTSSGTRMRTNCSTIFGPVRCTYATENTDLGTLQGGNPAKLPINATVKIVPESDPICGVPFVNEKEELEFKPEATWTAEYQVTSPKPLYVTAG
ncbi:MAG TPA: hypothetical protein VI039_08825 [Solirubrobacterales bacterium]